MTRSQVGLALLMVAGLLVIGPFRWTLQAQVQPRPGVGPRASAPPRPTDVPAPAVADALLRPFDLPFERDTPLDDVAALLRDRLRAPVVLDLAALKRLDLTPQSTVRLKLEGVRLKNGLKLLLDQVGMTYRLVPEDNLLVLTDPRGADDPLVRIREELESLHKDVHDLQDAVEEVYQSLSPPEGEAETRNPTMIEEVPADPDKAPPDKPGGRPRAKPG